MNICRENMSEDNLLIQINHNAMSELIDASSLPFFNSDRMIERGYVNPDRVTIPINNSDAHAVYYIACLASYKKKYGSAFNAVRSVVLNGNM